MTGQSRIRHTLSKEGRTRLHDSEDPSLMTSGRTACLTDSLSHQDPKFRHVSQGREILSPTTLGITSAVVSPTQSILESASVLRRGGFRWLRILTPAYTKQHAVEWTLSRGATQSTQYPVDR